MADITSNLVHRWKFDEASSPWTDSVGGIVASEDPSITGDIAARVGTCIDFDGSNDLDLDSSFAFALNEDFTFAAWLNMDVLGVYAVMGLDANADNYWLLTTSSVQIRLNALTATMTLSPVLDADRFYHVAVTRTGGDEITVYIDGVAQVDTETNNRAVTIDKIGSTNSGSTQFNGFMDELRIYRRGLSAVEVAYLADYTGDHRYLQSSVNPITFNDFGF